MHTIGADGNITGIGRAVLSRDLNTSRQWFDFGHPPVDEDLGIVFQAIVEDLYCHLAVDETRVVSMSTTTQS